MANMTDKFKGVARQLKRENTAYNTTTQDDTDESFVQVEPQDENCLTRTKGYCATAGRAIADVLMMILNGIYWIIGLGDDAFAVEDTAEHESVEN
jgi:hypothetical protein